MNKTELVAAIAEEAQISKKDAEAAVKAFVAYWSAFLCVKVLNPTTNFPMYAVSPPRT